MAIDKIVAEYRLELDGLKADINQIKGQVKSIDDTVKTSADNSTKKFDEMGSSVSGKLTSAFTKLGGAIAAAFAVERIGAFISSSIELATQTQEVKAAFDRLNNPALLSQLKAATEGTLSDLKLMGIALKADKLQIPLEKLGKILQFSKLRADELGKSTEELAETIIQGIGTNGTRALVQVGISQESFGAEVKKTGDYFDALDNIMTTTLNNAGEGFESVADKQDKLRASIEDTKAEIGRQLLPVINQLLIGINNVASGFGYLFNASEKHWKSGYDAAVAYSTKWNLTLDEINSNIEYYTDTLEVARKKQAEVNEKFFATPAEKREANTWVKTLEGSLQAYKDLGKQIELSNKSQANQIDYTKLTIEQLKELAKVDALAAAELEKRTKKTKDLTTATKAQIKAYQEWAALVEQLNTRDVLPEEGIETATINVDKLADAFLNVRKELDELIKLTPTAASTTEDTVEQMRLSWEDFANSIQTIFSSFDRYFSASSQYREDLLKNELDNGIINQEEFDRKSAQIKRREAERAKRYSFFSATIDTARAIVAALPNVALSALAAVTGAIQLAVIAATPLPAFKDGVIDLKGKGTGTSDSNLALLSKGESVITAKATRKHKDALEAIQKDKFEDYIMRVYLKQIQQKQSDSAITWDDYRLMLEMSKNTNQSKENTKQIVNAIQRKPHRF